MWSFYPYPLTRRAAFMPKLRLKSCLFSAFLLVPLVSLSGCSDETATTVMPAPEIDDEAYEEQTMGGAANDPAQN